MCKRTLKTPDVVFCSLSNQPKSKPCLVKRASSGETSDNEGSGRDTSSARADSVPSSSDTIAAAAAAVGNLTLTTPTTARKRASPCNGILLFLNCQYD
jgi:hypothetical protein